MGRKALTISNGFIGLFGMLNALRTVHIPAKRELSEFPSFRIGIRIGAPLKTIGCPIGSSNQWFR